jgi:Uma2 family endonuclease
VALARQPKTNATFADLDEVPEHLAVEIVHGEIVEKALPTMEHGDAQGKLAAFTNRYFARKPGGRWPGGWWIGTEVDVEYEAHELFRHDLTGWRRARVPERPTGRPIRIRPDWVCEILSTNRRRDLVDKLRVLQAAGMPFYWVVDPEEKSLTVMRLEPQGYVIALAAAAGEAVRAQPFDAVELRVSAIFGDEDLDD